MVTLHSMSPVQAQSITQAEDGTGTVVTINGNQYDIFGGSLSGDGANLFHSLQEFELSANEIANFLSTPNIQNILGRVVGGNASMIDGLIQVTGGNANLFLINPAGIVFGVNSRLNVMGDFTATTATGIGFEDNGWFNAFGDNNYETLIGNPSQFAFDLAQSGSIVNEGNLAVGEGQTLTLLGGSVTNQGELTAPGGNINIAAVAGENLVRVSQPGHLLSLEFVPPQDGEGGVIPVQPLDLAVLLTGTEGQVNNQGQVSVDSPDAGEVNLAGTVVYNQGQITADGENGGRIQIETKNLLDSGILSASGSDGQGGEIQIDYTGTLIQTASALTSATGTHQGGEIGVYGGEETQLTTSGRFDATGEVGGSVHLFGQDVRLLAADVDVSGNSGGGEILVGGDFQGNPLNLGQGGMVNAQNTLINHATILRADALTEGNAGKVIAWSDQLTQFAGTIQARGGAVMGDGGFVEVSGKETLAMAGVVEAGAVNGEAGTLLLDPKNIVIDDDVDGIEFPQLFDLVDPNEGGGTGFGQNIVPLSTGNVVVTKPGDNFAAENAGAVYLYNGETGALISTLTGSQNFDYVGVDDEFPGSGVVALTNGNYVVRSHSWNNGEVRDAGAVTWGDGNTGISGAVSQDNSLVGSQAFDRVGDNRVVALTNGNYVVLSPDWNNGGVSDAGAVTWGDGSTGISGAVSQDNSLVGSQAGDEVGNFGSVVALTNGNYVVSSPDWDNGGVSDAGAVTWGNGSTGISGAVSQENSLVGSQADDRVGISVSTSGVGSNGVVALTNGNYVVSSNLWNNGGVSNAGAVTWGNGSTGITGEVSQDNSLVGSQAFDRVGSNGVVALTNGNYVVSSNLWNNGGVSNAGAVTWGDGSTGITGEVSQDNSLFGTQADDFVGNFGSVVALTNGNYVVRSPDWDKGEVGNAGAVTWGNGSTGITGEVSQDNSLVGSQAFDRVGNFGVVALTNGNYVVRSSNWDNGGVNDAGAVTWGNGTTGTTLDGINTINPQNSIVGRTANANLTTVVEDPINEHFLVSFLGEGSGRVTVAPTNPTPLTIPSLNPDQFQFRTDPSATVTLTPSTLQQTLSAGTDVVLQANNDITVNRAITSTNPNGNGGDLTMQAGRSILVNADIFTDNGNFTLISNETTANGVVNAHRDPGQAVISIAPGISLNSGTGDTTLILGTGDGLTNNASGDITASTITGGNITLINNRGGINTSTGTLRAESNGTGGTITLDAVGNIITNDINTNSTLNNGGTIHLTSNSEITTGTLNAIGNQNGGNILLDAARTIITNDINTNSTRNNGGTIRLTSNSEITTGTLNAIGNQNGGTITLTATDNISTDNISTTSSNGTGGTINLDSDNDITTAILDASGNTSGGTITLQSAGQINTNGIIASSENGQGGTINLNSDSDIITTAILNVSGNTNGGNITFDAAGNITTDTILFGSENGQGGTINFNSNGNITTAILNGLSNTNGGDINLQSTGKITTQDLLTNGVNGDGGDIHLTSGNEIITGALNALSNGAGGNITLNGASHITTQTIIASGANGNGGTIDIDSGGSITILNDTFTNQGGIVSFSSNGNGGDITLNASTSINTGSLPLSSTSAISNGGKITLNSDNGDITVAGINTEGGIAGTGGAVDITTPRFFRATDSFANLNGTTASISTGGVTAGGTITIRHGGAGVTPFIVGDASTNGTAGAITTGNTLPEQTISPTAEFPYTHTQDGIQIISVPAPGSNSEPPIPPSPPSGSERPSDSPGDAQTDLAFLVGDIVGAQTSVNQDPLTGESSFVWNIPGTGNLDTGRINIPNLLAQNLNDAIPAIDDLFEGEYEDYLGEDIANEEASVETIRNTLNTITTETGTHPVIVYAVSLPDQLELIMIVPDGTPIRKTIPAANAKTLKQTLDEFRRTVTNVLRPTAYLRPGQQLYNWMIAPLEPDLEALGIDTLIFSMDAGLRTIPMAALHDGEKFLIEKYAIGSIPSVSLTNTRYNPIKDAPVLAMGASEFTDQRPLPAVPIELETITQKVWSGEAYLNDQFTLNNLQTQRQQKPWQIIHLASHADFQDGDPSNSYIQLWDTKLQLDQMRQLGWHEKPQVDLLVLSACRTAFGSLEAELGFAGLAVKAGVKSALASLWYVSDGGSLALMSEFYHQLGQPDVTIKAEALRRAQLALLRGEVRVESGELRGLGVGENRPVVSGSSDNQNFSHPYYWAAFTMIGSPW
ncbi:CHAT domain-containing protein [Coleofasciculus sp. G1-WW12-02]|uniref:CHAT domain-containing protein n=1 Tax=Coleofasciculus sp. G1-WW12-02 TaxID=3068483 RepID=UPI0040638B66